MSEGYNFLVVGPQRDGAMVTFYSTWEKAQAQAEHCALSRNEVIYVYHKCAKVTSQTGFTWTHDTAKWNEQNAEMEKAVAQDA